MKEYYSRMSKVRRCNGWEQSCGCNIEHDVAMRFKAHGIKDFKIMYE